MWLDAESKQGNVMVRLTVGNFTQDYATGNYTHVDDVVSEFFQSGTASYSLRSYTATTIYDATIFSTGSELTSIFFGRAVAIPGPTGGFLTDAILTGKIDGVFAPRFMLNWINDDGDPDDLAAHLFGGNDIIQGGRYGATLEGFAGNDTIVGGPGADMIVGGARRDTLTGGGGADRFVYAGAVDLAPGKADVIKDFSHADGDRIDLSAFDADPAAAGVQPLTFVGEGPLPVGGEEFAVRIAVRSATVNVLQFDLDHDGSADRSITVFTPTVLTASDLGLAERTVEPLARGVFGDDTPIFAGAAHGGQPWIGLVPFA